MVVKLPENQFQKDVYDILTTNPRYKNIVEGNKGIVYDTIQDIMHYVSYDYTNVNPTWVINKVLNNVSKHGSRTYGAVLCLCINDIFRGNIATMQKDMATNTSKLIIRNLPHNIYYDGIRKDK